MPDNENVEFIDEDGNVIDPADLDGDYEYVDEEAPAAPVAQPVAEPAAPQPAPAAVAAEPVAAAPAAPPLKVKHGKAWAAVMAVVVLAGVGGGGYFLYDSGAFADDKGSSTVAQSNDGDAGSGEAGADDNGEAAPVSEPVTDACEPEVLKRAAYRYDEKKIIGVKNPLSVNTDNPPLQLQVLDRQTLPTVLTRTLLDKYALKSQPESAYLYQLDSSAVNVIAQHPRWDHTSSLDDLVDGQAFSTKMWGSVQATSTEDGFEFGEEESGNDPKEIGTPESALGSCGALQGGYWRIAGGEALPGQNRIGGGDTDKWSVSSIMADMNEEGIVWMVMRDQLVKAELQTATPSAEEAAADAESDHRGDREGLDKGDLDEVLDRDAGER